MKWYEKMKCISQSYEQMRENTNYLSPPTPILFSSSEAVDETKPKGSARQDEGQGEEREADQEHAWTLRNGFPHPHPPLSWALSLPPSSQLPSEVSLPVLLTSVSPSSPTRQPSFSLCGKHLKKKKKQERPQVKQCGLNIFCFLVLLWRVFGNDDPIILGNSCTVSKFFDLVRVALWESTFLSISLFQVCVQCSIHPRSQKYQVNSKPFFFSSFQCDGMNKKEKKSKIHFVLKINK